APLLGRAAAVVRQGRDVLDGLDGQAGRLQGGDGRLAPGAGALDAHLDLLEAELAGPLGGDLGGPLGGERRALARALETDRAGGGVAERVAVGVGDGDDGVVERRLDVGDAPADLASLFAFLALGHGRVAPPLPARRAGEGVHPSPARRAGGLAHLLDALLAGDGLARPLAGAGVGAGSLAAHRQAAPVPQAAVALDVLEAGDVLLHQAAQRALDGVLAVEDAGDAGDVLVREFAGAPQRVDAGLLAQAQRR